MLKISIVNNKGGVGKTTVATWLSQGLAILGKKVLVIDNDKQHNATAALCGDEVSSYQYTIRDIYQLQSFKPDDINELLNETVQSTSIENLYYIPSTAMLSHLDVIDTDVWNNVFAQSSIKDFFDVVIFDNPPGSDLLQSTTLLTCDIVLIPTELKTRATQGLFELYAWLTETMNFSTKQIKIIPNGYKKWSKYEGFLEVIRSEFSESLTTAIPYDEVFDELDATNKILFFSRLRSKVVPYIIKVLSEIFPDLHDTKEMELTLYKARSTYQSQQARLRYKERLVIHG